FKTNVMQAWHTNTKVLNLTNWTTVLAFKTNWVTQPMTNMVEIEMERTGSASAARNSTVTTAEVAPAPAPSPVQTQTTAPEATVVPSPAVVATPQPAPSSGDALVLAATGGNRTPTNSQINISLTVRWSDSADAPVLVQQWRVEREDASILCF